MNRLVVTNWNAGIFHGHPKQLLPELIVYCLLYDEVLIREEDLITNRVITGVLLDDHYFATFAELLSSGLVKLLRLPSHRFSAMKRTFDPRVNPISARAEEHIHTRSYKGSPWRPTAAEWHLFTKLDRLAMSEHASREHRDFPASNVFVEQLASILQNTKEFAAIYPNVALLDSAVRDHFTKFATEEEAWVRFVRDRGRVPISPDSQLFRSAVYQCARLLSTDHAVIERLAEWIYADLYCERENAEGVFSDHGQIPTSLSGMDEIVKVGVTPSDSVASVNAAPGIARILLNIRETPAFRDLQNALYSSADSADPVSVEGAIRCAWRDLVEIYVDQTVRRPTPRGQDHAIAESSVWAFIAARAFDHVGYPHLSLAFDFAVFADHLATKFIEHTVPGLAGRIRSFWAVRRTREAFLNAVSLRTTHLKNP